MSSVSSRALNGLSLAGLAATLIGNGIGRFAFIALMPALIQAGWFSQAEASALSVATLIGYVFGAFCADSMARRYPAALLLRGAMLVCAASFFAGAIDAMGMPWNLAWRTAAGFCGAILMVLPAPVVLPRHEAGVRGRASGIVFSGIGLGTVLCGFLVPALVNGIGFVSVEGRFIGLRGVQGAWLGMGVICLVLTVLSWHRWPVEPVSAATPVKAAVLLPQTHRIVALIVAAHALNAVGYLAHTLFWVDYLVRELRMSLADGGLYWSVFGVGAAIGPLITGRLADAFGLKRCLAAGFMLKALAAVLPVASSHPVALFASSLLMGVFTPGIVALVSAYALQCVGAQQHRRVWGMATAGFAIGQAVGGVLMAFAVTHMDSYRSLFVVSGLALIGATACLAAIRENSVACVRHTVPPHDLLPSGAAAEK